MMWVLFWFWIITNNQFDCEEPFSEKIKKEFFSFKQTLLFGIFPSKKTTRTPKIKSHFEYWDLFDCFCSFSSLFKVKERKGCGFLAIFTIVIRQTSENWSIAWKTDRERDNNWKKRLVFVHACSSSLPHFVHSCPYFSQSFACFIAFLFSISVSYKNLKKTPLHWTSTFWIDAQCRCSIDRCARTHVEMLCADAIIGCSRSSVKRVKYFPKKSIVDVVVFVAGHHNTCKCNSSPSMTMRTTNSRISYQHWFVIICLYLWLLF